MRVLSWPEQQGPAVGSSVVTLGVFDGVHRGHCRVLEKAVSEAKKRACTAVVVTFDRHPGAVLRGEAEPSITSLEHRIRLFESLGLELCVVIHFTEQVAGIDAVDFAERVFCSLLHAELLVLGFDCRFGRDGQGGIELCRRLGPALGFDVVSVPPVEVDGEPVSSTAIREAIRAGELARAEKLLGRPFALYGTVVGGQHRGAELGFRTANLDLHHEISPPDGVYATWFFHSGERMPSVTSIGRQPTFDGSASLVVEVHVIDRRVELYGEDVEVQFVLRLRDQQAFRDADELAEQIGRDTETAKAVLRSAEEAG